MAGDGRAVSWFPLMPQTFLKRLWNISESSRSDGLGRLSSNQSPAMMSVSGLSVWPSSHSDSLSREALASPVRRGLFLQVLLLMWPQAAPGVSLLSLTVISFQLTCFTE